MTSGDFIQQFGPGSIGKAQHSGSGDIVTGSKNSASAIDELLHAISVLKEHLNDEERKEVDVAVQQIDLKKSRSELEGPLKKIAGIAALVENFGVPVIGSIREFLASIPG
jgi:hypothetical protein